MRQILLLAAICLSLPAMADNYAFSVVGRKGIPLANAVIALGKPTRAITGTTAVMDQKNKQFVPYVLPIAAGTLVAFPNSDQIRHQVYSFSETHPFEIKLYEGEQADPIRFNKPGIIVLGCNIHDNMVGYIYVTAQPVFGKTDKDGRLELAAPAGVTTVTAWHPALSIDAQKQLSLKLGQLDRARGRYVIHMDIPAQPADPQAVAPSTTDRFRKFLQQ